MSKFLVLFVGVCIFFVGCASTTSSLSFYSDDRITIKISDLGIGGPVGQIASGSHENPEEFILESSFTKAQTICGTDNPRLINYDTELGGQRDFIFGTQLYVVLATFCVNRIM